MNLHCGVCGRDAICVCHLPDDPTDAAMEILERGRTLVLKVAEAIAPPFRWPYYSAATCLSTALLHVAGFDGPVGA